MKTSLQENRPFKTIPAGRKIAPPNCEHNKHVPYCLFSHFVAWQLDFNTPKQQPCSVPTATQQGSQTNLEFRYGFHYPCWTTQSTLITVLDGYAISTHSLTQHVQLWLTLKYYCVYTGLMAGDKANCQKKTSGG